MITENMFYVFFGNNLVIGKHIKKQLSFLESIVPREFLYRQVDDLGCGDGKVTLLLKQILQPTEIHGFDINHGLVRRAREKGIIAQAMNLDDEVPHGEMAVVWGVLHHLKYPERCLQKLKENYPLIFIREPVKPGIVNGMELGHPMKMNDLISMFRNRLPDLQMHYCENSVMAFYTSPEYMENSQYNICHPEYKSTVQIT